MNPLPLGRIVATPGALEALREAGVDPGLLLLRHSTGDWGDLDAHDKRQNEIALVYGSRVLSAYIINGTKFYVITEATDDNGVGQSTCLLLPSEY